MSIYQQAKAKLTNTQLDKLKLEIRLEIRLEQH